MTFDLHLDLYEDDMALRPETIAEIERIRAALPVRRSALLPALKAAQQERGWLPQETMAEVARTDRPRPNAAYMLATFYTMLHTEPVGHYALEVCRSLPCYLRGSDEVTAALKRELQVDEQGNSADGLFSLHRLASAWAIAHARANDARQRRLRRAPRAGDDRRGWSPFCAGAPRWSRQRPDGRPRRRPAAERRSADLLKCDRARPLARVREE